jgi:hypothetical protein
VKNKETKFAVCRNVGARRVFIDLAETNDWLVLGIEGNIADIEGLPYVYVKRDGNEFSAGFCTAPPATIPSELFSDLLGDVSEKPNNDDNELRLPSAGLVLEQLSESGVWVAFTNIEPDGKRENRPTYLFCLAEFELIVSWGRKLLDSHSKK